jgi:ribosomal subunit interface protein
METLMQIPLQVTFHGVDHSEAVETRIREKVGKLEQLYDRITSCRVVIEAHHRNTSNLHHKGEPFHIRIDLTVPGTELVVKRDPKDPHVNEDIYVALREAFDSMERQLKEFAAMQRGESKPRPEKV